MASLNNAQMQCAEYGPNDCANPCYVSPIPTHIPGFGNAIDCNDCDDIYNRLMAESLRLYTSKTNAAIVKCNNEIEDASDDYQNTVNLEIADYSRTMAQTDVNFLEAIEIKCRGTLWEAHLLIEQPPATQGIVLSEK